ncbi:hypothetical protein LINGRAHAP2_LOCUS4489 [Linum grandiflorum]
MITKLGDDLLIEILVRLPNPRIACRAKAVCKRWRSVISDPTFARLFLCHHESKKKAAAPPPMLLLSADSLTFIPMPARSRNKFIVFDCFKDLLLCGFYEATTLYADWELARTFFVCNLFTKQWIALPLAPEWSVGITRFVARLVCEPLIPNSLDDLAGTSRFRVVCIYQDNYSMKLEVFSSESGKWNKEATVMDGYRIFQSHDVVSCNRLVYLWYRILEDYFEEDTSTSKLFKPLIAGFDPFRLDMPPTLIHDDSPIIASAVSQNRWWSISVSQGVLHLSVFDDDHQELPKVLSVWKLREDGKVWIKVGESPVNWPNYKSNMIGIGLATLHPDNPEIAFFNSLGYGYWSCYLGNGGETSSWSLNQTAPIIMVGGCSNLGSILVGLLKFQATASCDLCTMATATVGFRAINIQPITGFATEPVDGF